RPHCAHYLLLLTFENLVRAVDVDLHCINCDHGVRVSNFHDLSACVMCYSMIGLLGLLALSPYFLFSLTVPGALVLLNN
ncbi:Pre-mRNA-splicing factor prp12, partial [Frankliniella fusca]